MSSFSPRQGAESIVSQPWPQQSVPVALATAAPSTAVESRAYAGGAPRRGGGAGFWIVAALLLGAAVVDAVALVSVPSALRPAASEGGQLAGYLVATICCAVGVVRSPAGRIRGAWAWIGVAFASNAIAEGIYGYLVLVRHQPNPFPSLADLFYLLFYPLMAIGVSQLPAAPASGVQRLMLALDSLIVAGSLLSVSWFFLLGPLYLQGADSPSNLALSLAYPVGDLMITMALIVLALRGFDRAFRPVYLWLMAGMVVTVYADSAYTYLGLQNTYVTGLPAIDPFWPAAAFLISLAPLYQLARFSRAGVPLAWLLDIAKRGALPRPPNPSLARLALPYVPVALLFGLVTLTQLSSMDMPLAPLLIVLALIVVSLIIARQLITQRENALLASRQAEALEMLAQANGRIGEYAHELEVGLQHLSAVQARIAQGDFSARVPVLHGNTLFPVTAMLNLMLERVESAVQAKQQSEHLAVLALRLAQICREAEAGDWAALQVLARPSGTALDPIARMIAALQQRVAALEVGRPAGPSRPWGST